MAALSGMDLIPTLRRLDTAAAFQVVGTWTAKPSRLHGPGCRHPSFEQPPEAAPLRMVKTSTRMQAATLQPALCPRYSQLPATVQ